jgi:cytidylate kinase
VSDARRPRPIVAIDGPAGAGKSTVARRLADELSFILVDTGAMYRAVALAAERAGIGWSECAAVGELALSLVTRRALVFHRDAGKDDTSPGVDRGATGASDAPSAPPARGQSLGVRVWLDGEDVSDAIRTPQIGMGASTVSAHKQVRDALLDMQRQAGRQGGVVLEGRDIGTVVFPDAEVKFFLTARPEVRARRRYDELTAKGARVTLEETVEEVRRRDEQDTTRVLAPLQRADDATLIDNSDITVDETVARMVALVRERSVR